MYDHMLMLMTPIMMLMMTILMAVMLIVLMIMSNGVVFNVGDDGVDDVIDNKNENYGDKIDWKNAGMVMRHVLNRI